MAGCRCGDRLAEALHMYRGAIVTKYFVVRPPLSASQPVRSSSTNLGEHDNANLGPDRELQRTQVARRCKRVCFSSAREDEVFSKLHFS